MLTVRSTSAVRFAAPRGFTFIELMIVVAILGVTVALSVPRVAEQMSVRRVQAAGSIVAADVEEAFALAGSVRRPMRLTWVESSGELVLADRASGDVYRHRALDQDALSGVTSASMTPPTVDFFPSGTSSSAITIELRSGEYSRVIRATRAGLVHIGDTADEP